MIEMIFDLIFGVIFGNVVVEQVYTKPATKPTPKPTPKPAEQPKPTKVEEKATEGFTEQEIGYIVSRMGKDLTARLTPYGNVIVQHKNATKTLFAFYKREDGYLIRRRLGYDNPYGSGNVLNGGNTFESLEKAMDYFVEYRDKYPNSLL